MLHAVPEKGGLYCRAAVCGWVFGGGDCFLSIEVDLVHIADEVHVVVVELEDLAAAAAVDLANRCNEVLLQVEACPDVVVDYSLGTHSHHHRHVVLLSLPLLLVVLVGRVAGLDAEEVAREGRLVYVDEEGGVDQKRLDDVGIYLAQADAPCPVFLEREGLDVVGGVAHFVEMPADDGPRVGNSELPQDVLGEGLGGIERASFEGELDVALTLVGLAVLALLGEGGEELARLHLLVPAEDARLVERSRVAQVDLGCDFPQVHCRPLVLVPFLEELAEVEVQLLQLLLRDGLAHLPFLAALGLPLRPLRLGLLLLRSVFLQAGLFSFEALVVEILEVQLALLLLYASLFGGACVRREGLHLLEPIHFLEVR